MARLKAKTTVTRKQAPATESRGVRPNMEEATVDSAILAIMAPFRVANVSLHSWFLEH